MQCTSSYPTPYEEVDLRVMHTLRREFDCLVGMSDHTIGIMVPVVAAGLGAVAVEKHFTMGRHFKGTDHACSLEPNGMRMVVRDIRNMELSIGDGVKRVADSTQGAKSKLGRSLVSKRSIPAGARLTEDDLCLKSPGTGLRWRDRDKLLGRRAKHEIAADVTLSEQDFE
jgi:sialic acid synthase SpsE